jgi:flagellar biosynthesis/type III secretory pathway protein FliH
VIRGGGEPEEVFVLGETVRETMAAPGPIVSASALLTAAEQGAEDVIARARAHAQAVLAGAEANADQVRAAAHRDGFEAGRAAAAAEIQSCVELARIAATEGKAIRDSVAEQAAGLVARATALATRRIVGEYYEADPERTAQACAEALRAVAGQEILSIRVHPGLVPHIQATLVDAARYVRPDDGIEIGGCIIELRHGTLDATLDARLSLMDLALREAGGEVGS